MDITHILVTIENKYTLSKITVVRLINIDERIITQFITNSKNNRGKTHDSSSIQTDIRNYSLFEQKKNSQCITKDNNNV